MTATTATDAALDAARRQARLDAARTLAVWLTARRDEHTPGNYPYWLLDCLLLELKDAIREGHVPGTELQRLARERAAGERGTR